MKRKRINPVHEYISAFSGDARKRLKELRAAIRAAAPGAQERISYGIPTFVLNGNLVHFAAYEKHIGFYPASSAIRAFRKELSKYRTSKGTVRFAVDRPLPLALIKKIVTFRVAENRARSGPK